MAQPLRSRSCGTLVGALTLAACQAGWVTVQVDVPKGSVVYGLNAIAADSASSSTVELDGGGRGLTFPLTYAVKVPPATLSIVVIDEGTDQTGRAVLRGSARAALIGGSGSVMVTLSTACASAADCDPGAVCQQGVSCSNAGACIAPAVPAPLAFGTPCGNDGGRCDEDGQCFSPWSTCGDGVVGQAPLPDGGLFVEACDWGSEGQCVGPDGGCNAELADSCRPDCLWPTCGDGVVDQGEVCDEGDLNGTGLPDDAGELCSATCKLHGNFITALAGNGDGACHSACYVDGPGAQAQFTEVDGLALVGRTLYIADQSDDVVRALDLDSLVVSTLAGNPAVTLSADGSQDGVGLDAGFYFPASLLFYEGSLVVGTSPSVRLVSLPGASVTTLAGPTSGHPALDPYSATPVPLAQASFYAVTGLASNGSTIYTVDQGGGFVRAIDLAAKTVSFLAGPGAPAAANFGELVSAVFVDGGLYVSDSAKNDIWLIDPQAQTATVVAGSPAGGAGYLDGVGTAAKLNGPSGLCSDGRVIYVMDSLNRVVRQLDVATGAVTSVTGSAFGYEFDNPYGCAWDADAGALYVSDQSTIEGHPDRIGNVIYAVH